MLLYHIKPEEAKKLKYKVYTCEHCGKMMGQKHVYLRHVRLHTGHRPWKCDECGKTFTMMSALNTHKKSHLDRKPYHCEICDQGFVDMTKYTKHCQTSKHLLKAKENNNEASTSVDQQELVEMLKLNNSIINTDKLTFTEESAENLLLDQTDLLNMASDSQANLLLQGSQDLSFPMVENNENSSGNASSIVISVPPGMSPDLITQLLQSGQLSADGGNMLVSPGTLDGDAVSSLLS